MSAVKVLPEAAEADVAADEWARGCQVWPAVTVPE